VEAAKSEALKLKEQAEKQGALLKDKEALAKA
jgi:hypothetical protein